MKTIARLVLAISILLTATGSFASWFGNNNHGWGGNNWNPYDEWDPRYWMEEMENEFDDDDDYYGPGYGYGPGPGYGYGPGPGYGYGPGPGYGYGPGPGYGYGPGPGYGYGPGSGYGPAPYPAPQQQQAPQQQAPAQR